MKLAKKYSKLFLIASTFSLLVNTFFPLFYAFPVIAQDTTPEQTVVDEQKSDEPEVKTEEDSADSSEEAIEEEKTEEDKQEVEQTSEEEKVEDPTPTPVIATPTPKPSVTATPTPTPTPTIEEETKDSPTKQEEDTGESEDKQSEDSTEVESEQKDSLSKITYEELDANKIRFVDTTQTDTWYEYKDSGFKVKFTKLEGEANLVIEEITLRYEQVKNLNAVSNKAYDVYFDPKIENGNFEYELQYPVSESSSDVQVKYSEDREGLEKGELTEVEKEVKVEDGAAKVEGLDHFTVFVVTADPAVVWPTEWVVPQCNQDPSDESPAQLDILGDATHSGVYYNSDDNYLYFRERIEGDPTGSGRNLYTQHNWVVVYDKDNDNYYDNLFTLSGKDEGVHIWKNTTQTSLIEWTPILNDSAEEKLWDGPLTEFSKIDNADNGYFFVTWAVPKTVLNDFSYDSNGTFYFATSADSNNANKDYLSCYGDINGEIKGYKYIGAQDTPKQGVEINICPVDSYGESCNGNTQSTNTNGSGYYEFKDLTPGIYKVWETIVPGFEPMYPAGGTYYVEVLGGTSYKYLGNLVNNGSFENPVVTHNKKWDIYPYGTSGLGWKVEWNGGSNSFNNVTRPSVANLELHRGVGSWSSDAGRQHAELDTDWDGPDGSLNNEPANVKITQRVPQCTDGTFDFSYAYSPRPNQSNNSMQVFWDGLLETKSASGGSNVNWQTVNHLGMVSTGIVGFAENGTGNSIGMFLDEVVIEQNADCSDGFVNFYNIQPRTTDGTINVTKYNDIEGDGRIDKGDNTIDDWGIVIHKISDDKLVEEFDVNSNDYNGEDTTNSLDSSKKYLIEVTGTWTNQNGARAVDTDYYSDNSWSTVKDFDEDNSRDKRQLDLVINNTDVNWASYNSSHLYKYVMAGTDSTVNFRIFDEDNDTNKPSWYNDNSGSLHVKIYDVTDEYYTTPVSVQVESGEYQIVEELKPGWDQTYPINPSYYHETIGEGQEYYFDFANTQIPDETYSLKGYKYEGEKTPLGGVTINICPVLEDKGNCIGTSTFVVTDPTGYYEFTGLNAGIYKLWENSPIGYEPFYPDNGIYYVKILPGGSYVVLGELVKNGGFENPVVANIQNWNIYESGDPALGWFVKWLGAQTSFETITRPDIPMLELQKNPRPNWFAIQGLQYAELDSDWDGPWGSVDGEPASTSIYQPLPVCVGGKYNLTYKYSPHPDQAASSINVYLGGNLVDSQTTGGNWGATSWFTSNISTLATSGGFLEFVDEGDSNSYGMFIDKVSVGQDLEYACEDGYINFYNTRPVPKYDIHGFKFDDINGDSEFDIEGENRLAGWTIFIDTNGNKKLDEGETSTVTSSDQNDYGWYWFKGLPAGEYSICEVQQDGWSQTFPQDNACHTVKVPYDQNLKFSENEVYAPEYNFGNHFEDPELTIEKFNNVNNGAILSEKGGFVTYTLQVTANKNNVSGVVVTDLPPLGFTVQNPGTWQVTSNVNGTFTVDDPAYASPGDWKVGDMQAGETITITYTAKIDENIDPGLYKDLAFAVGGNPRTEEDILATAQPTGYIDTNYVGTAALIDEDNDSPNADADIDEETKEEEIVEEGDVLGASTTSLPATGSPMWVITLALILLASGISIVVYSKMKKSMKVLVLPFALITMFTFTFSGVNAAGLSVRVEDPKTPTNKGFDLSFVAMDIDQRPVTAKCLVKKPGSASFVQFEDSSLISGGTSHSCSVNTTVLTTEGSFEFKVEVAAGGDTAEDTTTVFYDGTNPGKPKDLNVDKKNSCKYEIDFKTANDGGQTSYVEIYRDDSTSFTVNDTTRIASISAGSNEKVEYTDNLAGSQCGSRQYYAVRAFDSSGNASDVLGEDVVEIKYVTTTTSSSSSSSSSSTSGSASEGETGAIAAGTGGSVLGTEGDNSENAEVTAEENETSETGDNKDNSSENSENNSNEENGEVKGAFTKAISNKWVIILSIFGLIGVLALVLSYVKGRKTAS